MDDRLTAARRFCDARPYRIKRFDLALACFLEDYAAPFLLWAGYVPVGQRQLLPDLTAQLHALANVSLTNCTRDEFEQFHALVGKGLMHHMEDRKREMRDAQRIVWCTLAVMLAVYSSILLATITVSLWFMPGWCITAMLAYVICITDRHCGALFATNEIKHRF